jgi:hypothetical protein
VGENGWKTAVSVMDAFLAGNRCFSGDTSKNDEKYFRENEKIVCIFGKMGYNRMD